MKIIDYLLLRDINRQEQIEIAQRTGTSFAFTNLMRVYLSVLSILLMGLIMYGVVICILEVI